MLSKRLILSIILCVYERREQGKKTNLASQILKFYFRLEWESAVLRGVSTFQALEEERLNHLKTVLTSYFHHSSELGPGLIEVCHSIRYLEIQQSDDAIMEMDF